MKKRKLFTLHASAEYETRNGEKRECCITRKFLALDNGDAVDKARKITLDLFRKQKNVESVSSDIHIQVGTYTYSIQFKIDIKQNEFVLPRHYEPIREKSACRIRETAL